jgi:hypothetical protein
VFAPRTVPEAVAAKQDARTTLEEAERAERQRAAERARGRNRTPSKGKDAMEQAPEVG